MRFHSQYCSICKKNTLFLEKLTKPCDENCTEMEDICQKCKTPFFVNEKIKIKL